MLFDERITNRYGNERGFKIYMENQLIHRVNFRDLGGYTSLNGKKVRANMLFRSGDLSELTTEEVEYVRTLGISFICDLRSQEEQQMKPNPVIEGVENLSNPAMGGFVAVQNWTEIIRMIAEKGIENDPLLEMYTQFVTNPQSQLAYRKLIRSILESDGRPVLWHCTAGKDRTGFAAMIVLLLLEVPIETIVEDYMKTALYRLEANEKLMAQLDHVELGEEQLAVMRSLLGIKSEYIMASIEEIQKAYGSIDNYFAEGLGITEEEREIIKGFYLI